MHQIMTGHEECVQMLLEQEVSILSVKIPEGGHPCTMQLLVAMPRGWVSCSRWRFPRRTVLSKTTKATRHCTGLKLQWWVNCHLTDFDRLPIPTPLWSQRKWEILTWCCNQGILSFCIQILQNKQKIPLENIFPLWLPWCHIGMKNALYVFVNQ